MSCFFFNDTATTEIYTLSLHDALPISPVLLPAPSSPSGYLLSRWVEVVFFSSVAAFAHAPSPSLVSASRSEEHTSELQSRQYLVCRLLLEKKQHISYYSISSYTTITTS